MESKNRKLLRFCVHVGEEKCDQCENVLGRRLPSIAFHQRTDVSWFLAEKSSTMIADLGCPNTVIGKTDENKFIKSLSKYQQLHLKRVRSNEKFKFGPSGPYLCDEKLRFPVQNGPKLLWVEVALVQADIPMLLGNNILKPFGAEIKLFPEGNGILRLKNTEIVMRETSGGHFAIKVEDLGKLCENFSTQEENDCDDCGKSFEMKDYLIDHRAAAHEDRCYDDATVDYCGKGFKETYSLQYHTSALKNAESKVKHTQENCVGKVITDLNTLINGSKLKRDRKMIETMKSVLEICELKKQDPCMCDKCSDICVTRNNVKEHIPDKHSTRRKHDPCQCDECSDVSVAGKGLKDHMVDSLDEPCQLNHDEPNQSSHGEQCEDVVEFDQVLWDVLLSDKEADKLTENERKEVLKLHRYFAHRNGKKLWENIFLPAGKLKGKKKLVMDFLDHCDTCKKFRKTPPRPKVGMPKAKDINDVVSIDLKIFKKSKGKEIGILYMHDEFSKMIKG